MHTVDLLDEALALVASLGYQIRHEWLGGDGGGDCEIKGRKWLFIDLALSPSEQLDVVLDTLRREPRVWHAELNSQLRHRLGVRKIA